MILTTPERIKKVSDGIIDQIRDAVLSGQYKLGDKIGSEKEMLSQLNVGKATLREALRVLEAMGIIEIRKGLTGGVFVSSVDMKTTLISIMNFLNFQSVSIKDITLVRYILEPVIVQIVTSMMTEEDVRKISETIKNETISLETTAPIRNVNFHRNLARMTHNSILIFITDFIDNLLADIKAREKLGIDYYETITTYHNRILDCIRNKDVAGAIRYTKEDILFVGRYIAHLRNSLSFEPSDINEHLVDLIELPANKSHCEGPEQSVPLGAMSLFDRTITSVDGSSKKVLLRQVGSGKLYVFEVEETTPGNQSG